MNAHCVIESISALNKGAAHHQIDWGFALGDEVLLGVKALVVLVGGR